MRNLNAGAATAIAVGLGAALAAAVGPAGWAIGIAVILLPFAIGRLR